MATEILNGVRNYYGPQAAEHKVPGLIETDGVTREQVIDFAYDDLPAASADGSRNIVIPANSLIVSSRLHVVTAAAGGTSYIIGTYTTAGVAVDANGLHTTILTAALSSKAWLVGGGAQVGATVGTSDVQIVVAATGGFTAGHYRLILEYVEDWDS